MAVQNAIVPTGKAPSRKAKPRNFLVCLDHVIDTQREPHSRDYLKHPNFPEDIDSSIQFLQIIQAGSEYFLQMNWPRKAILPCREILSLLITDSLYLSLPQLSLHSDSGSLWSSRLLCVLRPIYCQALHLNEDHHQQSISTVWPGYAMTYAKFDIRGWVKLISVQELKWILFTDTQFLNSVRIIRANDLNIFSRRLIRANRCIIVIITLHDVVSIIVI